MKRQKRTVSIALLLLAAFLMITGSASAQGRVIHYWGDQVENLGATIPPPVPLPGGRFLTEGWLSHARYTADPEVALDLITGDWHFEIGAIRQPSGVMKAWGSGVSYLDEFGGLGCDEGGGGWLGTFHGTLVPNDQGTYTAVINGSNVGCGKLEGWTMKHQEIWYADGSKYFSGHFTPGK